jgi:hypothetical protein
MIEIAALNIVVVPAVTSRSLGRLEPIETPASSSTITSFLTAVAPMYLLLPHYKRDKYKNVGKKKFLCIFYECAYYSCEQTESLGERVGLFTKAAILARRCNYLQAHPANFRPNKKA